MDEIETPHGQPYLDSLLEDLAENPLDTTLRRMIADAYEDLDDTFTAELWRYHAFILENYGQDGPLGRELGVDTNRVLDHSTKQRIRDITMKGSWIDRSTSVRVFMDNSAPTREDWYIRVGILWLIENGFVQLPPK